VGTPTLIRVPSAFDHVKVDVMMQVLDAGATGIIAPQMDTPEIAKQIVAACRFPPVGLRSHGPTRAMHSNGPNYRDNANQTVVAIGMIESAQALSQLDAILDTPGLDGIYIGPNDLSLSLGASPASEPTDERVVSAIERIRIAAQQRGLIAGIFCGTGEACAMRLKQGFDMVTPAHDVAALLQGHAQRLSAARAS
jgi:4-hydroxy-2-oxoheptanedioate aldolase